MNTLHQKQRGFTLVEMIVVIAIIAILAAVIIPTTAGFIDRARFSNDQQTAAVMTQAIRSAYILGEASGELEAWQAKELIETYTEGEFFTFETTSRNSAFFYVPDELNSRVIILKFEDAAAIPEGELNLPLSSETWLSKAFNMTSVQANDLSHIRTPEQLFGNDRVMLTYSGSLVAEIVFGIRNGFSDQALRAHAEREDDFFLSLLERVFRIESHRDIVLAILDEFHPDQTVYISNGGTYTQARNPGDVTRVIFAPRISYLPSTARAYMDKITVLPSSIQRIDESLQDQLEALQSKSRNGRTLNVSNIQTLPDYSDQVTVCSTTWTNTNFNSGTLDAISYDFSNLEIRPHVTGYSVDIKGSNIIIQIFTREGLAARVVKTDIDACPSP